MRQLVLGSSSPFRAELLAKLHLPFVTASPDIDETIHQDEAADALVLRLAQQKARAVASDFDNALIIGSDQVAVIDGHVLGKPGNHANAVTQLRAASSKSVTFLTGLAVFNSQSQTMQSIVEPFIVHFRRLSDAQIENYLRREQPYECAGSFKSEGFGISLFSRLEGNDPNALIGLPLIQLIQMLDNEGVDVLQTANT